jgi:F0F1-type ATP synthase assembly protein I
MNSTQQPFIRTKPIQTMLRWQAIITVVAAIIAAVLAGFDGGLSAVLGGIVNLAAGAAYAFVVGIGRAETAGATLYKMFRAEAVKIALIVIQLWLILTMYHNIVMAAFFATFVLTALAFATAFTVRD